MQLLDGTAVAVQKRQEIAENVEEFIQSQQRAPGLAVVLVGEDPASAVYVRNKIKACEQVGVLSFEHRLPERTSLKELQTLITRLNQDDQVDGILVQLPLPKRLNEHDVLSWIDPQKDPDGLTTENLGLMLSGRARIYSCTPNGVMEILKHYDISIEGKLAVVVGRSNIVGKPMALLLQHANATVTVCHSRTPDISLHTKQADLVVVAAGKKALLGKKDFKQGAVVVDVGMHREVVDGKTKLCGDVRFEELDGWVSAATPVPGGVGPMTITMLLHNTLQLAKQRLEVG
ncbi:MAG: bifunctional methylenetetrahydrofolate dehydrogenase/methenyltetrahydrofolate cyclohydrolase FolD [Proteobacteria bacterium]|nr:bifunctional methylenetetrahydrofolate dehydrogenase/methenyltetrahydrofolate cyclohydrolase FolD [Pseudomonadota bacterium]